MNKTIIFVLKFVNNYYQGSNWEGATGVLVTKQGGFFEKVVTEQISQNSPYTVVFSTFFVI